MIHQIPLQFWLKVWGEVGSLPQYHQLSNMYIYQAYNHAVSGVSDLFHSESEQLAFQEISSPPPYMHAFLVNPNIFSTYRLTLPPAYRDPLPYVLIYAAIGLAGVVITTINTVVQYHGAIRASKLLFTRLLNTVVHATMRWHDVTPTGSDLFCSFPIELTQVFMQVVYSIACPVIWRSWTPHSPTRSVRFSFDWQHSSPPS